MATWPAGLPHPLVSGYNATDKWRTLETQMESGPPRRTQLTGHYLITGTGTMVLDATQSATFRAFMESTKSGTEWVTGVPVDVGLGIETKRARITAVQYAVVTPLTHYRVVYWWETDDL